MTYRNRYQWLVADRKRIHLITMKEKTDRGRTVFTLPEEFAHYLQLQGIEICPATNHEAAEWFHARLSLRERQQPGSVMPEDCNDWMVADIQARAE
jgi:hypothetical protein